MNLPKLSPKVQYEIHSGFNTVMAAIIMELGVQISTHQQWTDPSMLSMSVFAALGMALIRAGWKAAFYFVLTQLGLPVPTASVSEVPPAA